MIIKINLTKATGPWEWDQEIEDTRQGKKKKKSIILFRWEITLG